MNRNADQRRIGKSPNASNGSKPIAKSLASNPSMVLVFTRASLSNSSCILASIRSLSLLAPLLAASIAAPTANELNKPCGVNFRAAKALLSHNFADQASRTRRISKNK